MKRVLIVAFYFPPIQNVGVLRPLSWARHLPAFGWEPVVITVYPSNMKNVFLNSELLKRIGPHAKILRAFYPDFLKFPLFRGFLGKILYQPFFERWFIPGPERFWNLFALKKLHAYISRHKVHAVLTTSPPTSVNLLGMEIQRKYGIPWIMDMRDEWTTNPYWCQKYERFTQDEYEKEKKLEKQCLGQAACILTVSEKIKARFCTYGDYKGKMAVIPNGFDGDDLPVPEAPEKGYMLRMVYGGSLFQRNLKLFFQALWDLKNAGDIKPNTLKIEIYTASDYRYYLKQFKPLIQAGDITFLGLIKHADFLLRLAKSNVALIFLDNPKGADSLVTGKIFEILGLRKRVFAMVPPDGDAAAIVKKSGLGPVVALEDYAGIKKNLHEVYQQWNTGSMGVTPDEAFIRNFDRKPQVRYLSQILNKTVGDEQKKTRTNTPL
jgi:glycosyltransferase involved in cell wall biosynthesis